MTDGTGADDVVPIAGDSGADLEDVVPIKGDSATPAPEAPRPFVSNAPGDNTGYEYLASAIDELLPWWPMPPDIPFEVDPVVPTDVVPIAGDSGGAEVDDEAMFGTDGRYVGPEAPPPAPPPAPAPAPEPPATAPPVDYGEIDDLIDDVLERLGVPPDDGLFPSTAPRSRDPWLIAAIVAAVVVIAAVVGVALTRGSSTHKADSTTTTTSAGSTSTVAPTSTTATTIPASDVTLTLSLGQVSGASLPLLVTVQAASSAPGPLTVKVAMTGAGVPASDTYVVKPGASVTHTVVGQGCGSWTVQVVSIDGQPVHANGNPNLQNGATHRC